MVGRVEWNEIIFLTTYIRLGAEFCLGIAFYSFNLPAAAHGTDVAVQRIKV